MSEGDDDSVDPRETLGKRFSGNRERVQRPEETAETDEPAQSSGAQEAQDAHDTQDADGAAEATDAGSTGEADDPTPIRDRPQTAMYLPADQREALLSFYEELDARSTLAKTGSIEKHGDFFEAFIAYGLDHKAEIADRLGVELPDDIE